MTNVITPYYNQPAGVQANRTRPGRRPHLPAPSANHGMTKKSRRILHKGIDYVAPMPDNEEAASTSGRLAPQTETGIIFRTRPCRVLTERVRKLGGGGGGRAREAGRGGGVFSRSCRDPGVGRAWVRGWEKGLTGGFGGYTSASPRRPPRSPRQEGFEQEFGGCNYPAGRLVQGLPDGMVA